MRDLSPLVDATNVSFRWQYFHEFVNVIAKPSTLFVVLSIVPVLILCLYTLKAVISGVLICMVCDIYDTVVSLYFAVPL